MVNAKEMRELTKKRVEEIKGRRKRDANAFISSVLEERCNEAMNTGDFEVWVELPPSADFREELISILSSLGYQASGRGKEVHVCW